MMRQVIRSLLQREMTARYLRLLDREIPQRLRLLLVVVMLSL